MYESPLPNVYVVWLKVGLEGIFDPFISLFHMVLVPIIKKRSLSLILYAGGHGVLYTVLTPTYRR